MKPRGIDLSIERQRFGFLAALKFLLLIALVVLLLNAIVSLYSTNVSTRYYTNLRPAFLRISSSSSSSSPPQPPPATASFLKLESVSVLPIESTTPSPVPVSPSFSPFDSLQSSSPNSTQSPLRLVLIDPRSSPHPPPHISLLVSSPEPIPSLLIPSPIHPKLEEFSSSNQSNSLSSPSSSSSPASSPPTPTKLKSNSSIEPGGGAKRKGFPKGCEPSKGEWIRDPKAPYYTNSTCWTIQEHQNCMKYGRPNLEFLKWRWKPDGCELPLLEPAEFLELMRGKNLAFIGDSLARNQMQSLMCLLSRVQGSRG